MKSEQAEEEFRKLSNNNDKHTDSSSSSSQQWGRGSSFDVSSMQCVTEDVLRIEK